MLFITESVMTCDPGEARPRREDAGWRVAPPVQHLPRASHVTRSTRGQQLGWRPRFWSGSDKTSANRENLTCKQNLRGQGDGPPKSHTDSNLGAESNERKTYCIAHRECWTPTCFHRRPLPCGFHSHHGVHIALCWCQTAKKLPTQKGQQIMQKQTNSTRTK